MPKAWRAILPLFLIAAAPAMAQDAETAKAICAEVPAITKQLIEITGMTLRHPVPCSIITKDDVNKFLKERMKEAANPADLRAEELTLKKFGFVPQDFDLAKNTVDLLTEQAAAFYDFNKKKLFITESTAGEAQEPVLAHELGHALADQNFNLARYTKQGRKSDDGSTARLAVMEGQATWLMSEYMARKNGRTLKGSPELAIMMSKLSDSTGGQYPVFENEPLYLRETLTFPYTAGMLFQDALFQREGDKGFANVFAHAPVSTQQILHPEKYFAGEKPSDPTLPDPHLEHGYKGLIGGSLGELEHRILLEQYASKEQADAIAPHWRGCNFELMENKKAGRIVLLYAAEWDTEDAARQYLAAYRQALNKKWKSTKETSNSADSVSGEGDDGRFELRRTGKIVTSMEGLPPLAAGVGASR